MKKGPIQISPFAPFDTRAGFSKTTTTTKKTCVLYALPLETCEGP